MNMRTEPIETGLKAVAARRGWRIRPASARDIPEISADIHPDDCNDLASTWRVDWKNELYASLLHSDHAYVASREDLPGSIVFGVHHDRDLALAGQVWMVRTRTFSEAMERKTPADWIELHGAVIEVLRLFVRQYGTVFNFFPTSSRQTLRWLSLCGMASFGRSDADLPYLVCGAGSGFQRIANDEQIWNDYLGDLVQ